MERESDVRAGLHVAIVYIIPAAMESWSVADVCGFLIENGFDEEVVELFRCNKIRGKVLKLLTEGDMKEMGLTAIGDRRLLNHLLQQVHKLYYN